MTYVNDLGHSRDNRFHKFKEVLKSNEHLMLSSKFSLQVFCNWFLRSALHGKLVILTLRRPGRQAWRLDLFYGVYRSHLQVRAKRRKMTPLEILFSFF